MHNDVVPSWNVFFLKCRKNPFHYIWIHHIPSSHQSFWFPDNKCTSHTKDYFGAKNHYYDHSFPIYKISNAMNFTLIQIRVQTEGGTHAVPFDDGFQQC